MTDRTQAIALFREFAATTLYNEGWYCNIAPYIRATLLYGSVAKGTDRPDSDIDILLLVPLAVEEAYTTGEYFYTYQNQEINIVLRSIERLRHIADAATDRFQKEIFRDAVILSAADEEVDRLLQRIARI